MVCASALLQSLAPGSEKLLHQLCVRTARNYVAVKTTPNMNQGRKATLAPRVGSEKLLHQLCVRTCTQLRCQRNHSQHELRKKSHFGSGF